MFRYIIQKSLFVSFMLLVLIVKSGFAATWLDPSLRWKTIETPHFSIHYHEQIERIANRFAPVAEEVHQKLVPFMKYQSDIKIQVVLIDTVDYGNGYATVFPDPRVTLYLTDWSTNLNPSKYDQWLKFVFTHEYTHVLHLDMAEGLAALPRKIFGRIIVPNALSPSFMLEGVATYSETKNERWGRGDDPRWDMMMRMDVLENKIKTLDQASVDTVNWPDGHLRYIYGVEFLQYLSDTYGEERLIKFFHIFGNYVGTSGIDGAFYALYGKTLSGLWSDWLFYLHDKYERQKQGLGELTRPGLITGSGYHNLKPKWDKNSRLIYYQQQNADDYPGIRVVDPQTGEDKKIIEASVFAGNLSFDPNGQELLFIKSDNFDNYYTYSDICSLDLATKQLKQLTKGKRVTDADLAPDGKWIVFVENNLGTKTLKMITGGGVDEVVVLSPEAEVQYFSPRWTPDGTKFAVAKWTPGGQQKIYLVSPQTGIQRRLIEGDDSAESNPTFSPDGRYLFFDSDHSGIVNLYAYALDSKQLFQVTNVLGGAMMPDVSPDGKKLAYVSYSSNGYDLAVLAVEQTKWKEIVKEPGVIRSRAVPLLVPPKNYEVHDYNPLPGLLPKSWLPVSYTNENGSQSSVYLWGSDILGQHQYNLQYGYDFKANRPGYELLYTNNQFLPQLTLRLSETAAAYAWESATLWLRNTYGQVSVSLYDNRVFSEWDRQVVSVGYEQTNITNITSITAYTTKPSLGNINGAFVAWRYHNTRKYRKSISYEDGIDLTARVTSNSRSLGSDYAYTTYSANLASYFKMPGPHHVLTPTLYGFYSSGEQLAQSNFSWNSLPVRGYSGTSLQGNKGVSLITEYRFPIGYVERTVLYNSTFLDRIWGDVFVDVGGATFSPPGSLNLKRSYGAEFNMNTLLAGYFYLTSTIGYVNGVDAGGEEKFYFRFSM